MDINETLDTMEETDLPETPEITDHPLFICKTTIDIQTQEEVSKAVMGKAALGTDLLMYGMCLLVGGYLVLDSILNSRWGQNAFMLAVMVALAILTFVLRLTMPKKNLKRWEEAMIKKYGSPALHITTEFYNLSLAQTTQEDEDLLSVDGYSSIDEVKETENLFLLRYQKERYYFVAKKGFTLGSEAQFRSFITGRIGGK